jgi:hypothetical protein
MITDAATAIFVGDPKQPAALPQLILDAYATGARDITICPGEYTIAGTGKSLFHLSNWSEAAIHAAGVTIIADHVAGGLSLFALDQCNNVTLEGATLSQTAMTAYQGRVVAIGLDPAGKATCDWKPDAGFPVPTPDMKTFPFGPNVVDGATRLLKLNNSDYGGLPMQPIGDGLFRITFGQTPLKFQVGDWLVGRYGDANGKAPFKVRLVDCHGCTIKDITMSRNGFGAIREEGGGGNHLLDCEWTMGPRPAGATEDSIVTDAADGFHSTDTNPGPDIEGCRMEGVFLDDCFAIHGGFQEITAVTGNTLTLAAKGHAGLVVGQPARICSSAGFIDQTTVTGIQFHPDHTATVTLEKSIPAPPGSKINNPLSCGAGYKIIGCTLGNVRSRGILVKADDGLIKDNVIDGCVMSAISIGPEYYWNEAGYVRNLTIEGNTLKNNGRGFNAAVILIHGEGVAGNQHIIMQRNQFLSNYTSCLSINWAKDVIASANSITAPADAAAHSAASPFTLANCTAITLDKNVLTNAAAYKLPLIKSGVGVVDVHGDNVSE